MIRIELEEQRALLDWLAGAWKAIVVYAPEVERHPTARWRWS